jgi:MFS family permease
MGATSVMFIATANSLLQLNSSGAMRGRVMSLWVVVCSTPIGAPLIGFLAGRYGARFALGLGGVATVLVAIWAGLALRRIRDTRRLAAEDAAPPAAAALTVAADCLAIDSNVRARGRPQTDTRTSRQELASMKHPRRP